MGRMGRTNLRWEPTAAGKGGAECVAAARLMRAIQEVISLAVLWTEQAVTFQPLQPPFPLSIYPATRKALPPAEQMILQEFLSQGIWEGNVKLVSDAPGNDQL